VFAILAALVVSQVSGNSYVWVDATGTVVVPFVFEGSLESALSASVGLYPDLQRRRVWTFDITTAQIIDPGAPPLETVTLQIDDNAVYFTLPWCNGTAFSGATFIFNPPTQAPIFRRTDASGFWTIDYSRLPRETTHGRWSGLQPDGSCCVCIGGPFPFAHACSPAEQPGYDNCMSLWYSGQYQDPSEDIPHSAPWSDALVQTDYVDPRPSFGPFVAPLHVERR